jgi:MraZ protein
VYPRAEFEERARRAVAVAKANPDARAGLRVFAAGADEQHPDAQGRITLPGDLRRYANLSRECVVIGAVDYLEIWDAEAWLAYQQTHEEHFSAAGDEALGDIV